MKPQSFTTTRSLARLLSLLAGFSMSIVVQGPAVAGDGCDSATKVAADLWENWGDEVRAGGCLTAAAVSAILTQGATAASSAEFYQKCYATLNEFNSIATSAVKKWNTLVGNTWAQLGPRALEFNKTLSGTVVGPGDRMFISAAPIPADLDEVEIELKKEDGKSETEVTVCKVAANGQGTTLWSFTIDGGKDNQGKTWKKTFKNVDGYILSVFLNSKSVTRSMEYQLKATLRDTSTKVATTAK